MKYKIEWWKMILWPFLLLAFFLLIYFTILIENRISNFKKIAFLSQEVAIEWNSLDVISNDLLLKHHNNPYGDRTQFFEDLVNNWQQRRYLLDDKLSELSNKIDSLELDPEISIITNKTIKLWTHTEAVFLRIDLILEEIIDSGFAEKLTRGSLIEEFYKLRLLKKIEPQELFLGVKLISSIKILDDASNTFGDFLSELVLDINQLIDKEAEHFNILASVLLLMTILFLITGFSWKKKISRYTNEKIRLEEISARSTFLELFINGISDKRKLKILLKNLGFNPDESYYFFTLTTGKYNEILRTLGRGEFNENLLKTETKVKEIGKLKQWHISGYNVEQSIFFVLQPIVKEDSFVTFAEEIFREVNNNKHIFFYGAASISSYSGETPDKALSLIRKLLEERYRLKKPDIIWLEDLPEVPEEAFILSVDKEYRLCEKLKLSKIDEAELLFDEIIEEVIPYGYRVYKAVILRLIVTLSNFLEDLFDFGDEQNNTDVLTLILELEGLDTSEEVNTRFKEIFQLIIITLNRQRSSSQSRIIDQVRGIIKNEYMNFNLSADFISDKLEFSTGYLMKVFRNVSSHSIQKEINQFRLNKAEELIINSNKPIAQVALESGFLNSNYFFTLFKKYFGKTPREYKKSKPDIKQ